MKDDDIYAFGAPPALGPANPTATAPATATPSATRSPRPLWPWLLLAFGVAVLLLAMAGVSALYELLDGARQGLQVNVDGLPAATLHSDGDFGLMAALGLTAAVLLLLLVLPVVLMLVLLAVALAVGLALLSVVGAVVLAACAVLLVVATALSPLWGSALLLWLLLRRPRHHAAQASGAHIGQASTRQAAAAP